MSYTFSVVIAEMAKIVHLNQGLHRMQRGLSEGRG